VRRKWSAGVEGTGVGLPAVPFCCFVLCHSVLCCAPLRQSCCAPLRHAAQWAFVAGRFAVGTLWWQVRRKWSAGVGGFGLQFCFALFCACHSVPCCAPLRHAAQWAVVTCGFAVGTLWWQVRCPSEVECVCRGCRTACTSGSYVLLICAVLCCAVVGAGCRFGALCWQIRCFVLAGAL
jgi:hypothetical protein